MNENIVKIEEFLGIETGTIQKLVEGDKEVSVNLDGYVLRNSEQEQQLSQSIESKTQERYNAGLETGEKRAVNKTLEAMGLSLDKAKTIENLLPLYKDKVATELSIEPDKKVQQLQSDLTQLQTNYGELEKTHTQFVAKKQQEENQAIQDNNLLGAIPDGKYTLPKEDLLLLAKSKNKFVFDENNIPWATDSAGEVLKDPKTLKPIPAERFMKENFLPNYEIKSDGGAGGGDYVPGSTTQYDDFVAEMKNQGINQGGVEFQKEANKRIKEGSLKI